MLFGLEHQTYEQVQNRSSLARLEKLFGGDGTPLQRLEKFPTEGEGVSAHLDSVNLQVGKKALWRQCGQLTVGSGSEQTHSADFKL